MLTALLYLVVMAAVAAVVYLFATLVFGRGEEMAPLAPGSTPTTLPTAGVTGDDVRRLRFQQTVRGYKMSEVDWALGRLAAEVDVLRARLAELEGAGGRGPGVEHEHAAFDAGSYDAHSYDAHSYDAHSYRAGSYDAGSYDAAAHHRHDAPAAGFGEVEHGSPAAGSGSAPSSSAGPRSAPSSAAGSAPVESPPADAPSRRVEEQR